MRKKEKKYEKFDRGESFVPEHTGSATLVNVDGRWEHNFVDDEEPSQYDNLQDKEDQK